MKKYECKENLKKCHNLFNMKSINIRNRSPDKSLEPDMNKEEPLIDFLSK